jgi:chemotaxis protein CheC
MIVSNGVSHMKNIKLEPDEIKMCAVRLNGKGDTHIEILYTIKQKYAKKIAAKLLGQDAVHEIDQMGESAIQEVANIMTGSFFNALASGTGFRVDLSTPNFTKEELHLLVDNLAKDVVNPIEYAVIADVELVGRSSGTKLHMIIMQNPDNARNLLANHFEGSTNDKKANSYNTIENNTEFHHVGGSNSELDALLDDILKEKQ